MAFRLTSFNISSARWLIIIVVSVMVCNIEDVQTEGFILASLSKVMLIVREVKYFIAFSSE